MKRFYTIATALLLVAGSFSSCTKDLDEVSVMNASLSQDAKGEKVVNANQKVDGGLILTISKTNPVIGETVTITASFTENVTAGTLRIEELQADGVTWEKVVSNTLSNTVTSVSYDFTSNTPGSHTFRGFYTPTGQSSYGKTETAGSTITFTSECSGANLTAELVSSTLLESGLTEYKVALTLTSCTAFNNVKLQGGISATIDGSVKAISADGVEGNINYNNRNAVVSWAGLNLIEGYSNTFYVTFRMEKADKENPIGDWTAKVGEDKIAEATL